MQMQDGNCAGSPGNACLMLVQSIRTVVAFPFTMTDVLLSSPSPSPSPSLLCPALACPEPLAYMTAASCVLELQNLRLKHQAY